MASSRFSPQPTKKVKAYLDGQAGSVSPYNVKLMEFIDERSQTKALGPAGIYKILPATVLKIGMDTVTTMGKDATFFGMSLLTIASVMLRGVVVQLNGTERNNLTIYV